MKMRFLYLAIHYPKPEHARDLLGAMHALSLAMGKAPGLIEAAAWLEKGGRRIVATSTWESEEAFSRAIPLIGASIKDVPFEKWEEKQRELFKLEELSAAVS